MATYTNQYDEQTPARRKSPLATRSNRRLRDATNPVDYDQATEMMRSDQGPANNYTTPSVAGGFRTVVADDQRDDYGRAIYSSSASGATPEGFEAGRGINSALRSSATGTTGAQGDTGDTDWESYAKQMADQLSGNMTGTIDLMGGGEARVMSAEGKLARDLIPDMVNQGLRNEGDLAQQQMQNDVARERIAMQDDYYQGQNDVARERVGVLDDYYQDQTDIARAELDAGRGLRDAQTRAANIQADLAQQGLADEQFLRSPAAAGLRDQGMGDEEILDYRRRYADAGLDDMGASEAGAFSVRQDLPDYLERAGGPFARKDPALSATDLSEPRRVGIPEAGLRTGLGLAQRLVPGIGELGQRIGGAFGVEGPDWMRPGVVQPGTYEFTDELTGDLYQLPPGSAPATIRKALAQQRRREMRE
jgi:hypothetical protein